MKLEQLKRTSALWDALAQINDEEQTAWLEGLKGDDRDLIPALLVMREQQQRNDHALSMGVPAMTAGPLVPEASAHQPGDQVGPYRLQRLLGRGGMGEVWLARRDDGPVNRDVALKLPLLMTRYPAIQRRFERECLILSSLAHPHIATLYEAGVDAQGQAFMAMAFVDGLPLLRYSDERCLSVRQRVALFMDLLAAVVHAHAQLVIHRDIKPANVLVTEGGRVQLLDFGIAKLLDDAPMAAGVDSEDLTRWAGTALTLEYASPEQVQHAAVGTATDLYSLGVLLYELLTSERPYLLRGRTRRDLEAAILAPIRSLASQRATSAAASARATTATALRRQLRGDLDTILAKTLIVSPTERYVTVAAFADDLQRWLHSEPIVARPPSRAYVAWRFAQRHTLALAAGSTILVSMIVGATAAMIQARNAQAQQAIAQHQTVRAQAVSKFLEGVFGLNGRSGGAVQAARNRTARELLDEGAARVMSDASLDSTVRYDLLGTFGAVYREMGMVDESAKLAEQRRVVARQSFGEVSLQHAQAWTDLAWAKSVRGDPAAALKAAGEARTILRGLGRHQDELLANAWVRYAGVAADAGARHDVHAAQRAVDDGRLWVALSQDKAALSFFYMNAGLTDLQTGQRQQALAEMRLAMQLHDGLGETRRDAGFAVAAWLGWAELYNGNLAEARHQFERAISWVENSAVPAEEQWVYQGLTVWFDVTGNLDAAWRTARTAVERLQRLPTHLLTPEMRRPYMVLAKAAWRSGRFEEALVNLDVAEALHAQLSSSDHGDPVTARLRHREPNSWVMAYMATGRLSEAVELLEVHRRLLEGVDRGMSTFRGLSFHLSAIELALAMSDGGRARVALEAMKSSGIDPGDYQIYLAWAASVLEARVLTLEGRYDEARRLLQQVLSTIAERGDAATWVDHVARARFALGVLEVVSGRPAQALYPLSQAAQAFERIQAPGLSLDKARALRWRAEAQRRVGDQAGARSSQNLCDAIWKRHPTVLRRPDDRWLGQPKRVKSGDA